MHSLLLFAQETAEKATNEAANGAVAKQPWFMNPILWIGLMGLFYVLVILPQTRRRKADAAQQLADSMVPGTKVVTNSGIVGTIVKAKEGDAEVVIRSEDTKLRILRSTISQILSNDTTETK